jgi:hypothetical protein
MEPSSGSPRRPRAAASTAIRPLGDGPAGSEIDQSAPNAARIYDWLLGRCFL